MYVGILSGVFRILKASKQATQLHPAMNEPAQRIAPFFFSGANNLSTRPLDSRRYVTTGRVIEIELAEFRQFT